MSKSKSKRVNVPAEVFVKAVVEAVKNGQGHEAVAKACNMKVTSVATRVSVLRKAGVNLPKFVMRGSGGGRKLNIEALNSLIN